MASSFHFGRRTSGVLMHLTALPSRHGSGDLGREAFDFVDFLAASRQSWWQMLPHNPPGNAPGYSPYSAPSSFAGSPWFVSLDDLVDRGYLDKSDLKPSKSFRADKVMFDSVDAYRDRARRIAFLNVCDHLPQSFHDFVARQKVWLDGWSLWSALRWKFDGAIWTKWPEKIRKNDPKAVAELRDKLSDEITYHQWVQWLFFEQWAKLRKYAASKGVGLIGDVPIFVGHDSADVWSAQHLFQLDTKGHPQVVSGCPPDAFNKLGQVWNHPHYDWKKHERENFAWWVSRFRATFELFDAVRIDHFLGFYRLWAIPFGAKHAKKGHWIFTPGEALFKSMKKSLGELPIIAEDLGTVTPQAIKLRDDFNFPGMRVLMFAFNGGWEHMPHNYVKNCVVYTGTHDCDTVNGYVAENRAKASKDKGAKAYIENLKTLAGTDANNAAGDMIRLAQSSVADTVIVPTQDILGLGSEARFNLPGTEGDNWHWRLKPGALTSKHAKHLANLATLTQRVTT
jgi:4-alpha-glucanotransferase